MRYVLVDLDGAVRDRFSSREAAQDVLLGLEEAEPGIAGELYVMAYDDEGRRIGSAERGDELLSHSVLDWSSIRPDLLTGHIRYAYVAGSASSTIHAPSRAEARPYAGAHR